MPWGSRRQAPLARRAPPLEGGLASSAPAPPPSLQPRSPESAGSAAAPLRPAPSAHPAPSSPWPQAPPAPGCSWTPSPSHEPPGGGSGGRRSSRLGRGRLFPDRYAGLGAGGRGQGRCLGRGVSDKFGEAGLLLGCACWGTVPLVVRAGVAEILVVMAMLVTFRGWVGAGSSAPLGVHPSCGSLWWKAGGGSLGRLLPERGDGAMLDHFAARRSSYRRPRPLP